MGSKTEIHQWSIPGLSRRPPPPPARSRATTLERLAASSSPPTATIETRGPAAPRPRPRPVRRPLHRPTHGRPDAAAPARRSARTHARPRHEPGTLADQVHRTRRRRRRRHGHRRGSRTEPPDTGRARGYVLRRPRHPPRPPPARDTISSEPRTGSPSRTPTCRHRRPDRRPGGRTGRRRLAAAAAAEDVLAAHLRARVATGETGGKLLEPPGRQASSWSREPPAARGRRVRTARSAGTRRARSPSRRSPSSPSSRWRTRSRSGSRRTRPSIHLRDKAFLVALAAFDDGPYALTAELSDLLYRFLQQTENRSRVPEIPVFGTHIGKRLQLARAEPRRGRGAHRVGPA